MSMQALIDYLSKKVKAIQAFKYDGTNAEIFYNLVVDDFVGKIFSDTNAAQFYKERLLYYGDLPDRPDYQRLQLDFFAVIQELEKYLNKKHLIKDAQDLFEKHHGPQTSYNNHFKVSMEIPDYFAYAELAFNTQNYHLLKEITPSGGYTKVLEQYKSVYGFLSDLFFVFKDSAFQEKLQKVSIPFKRYEELLRNLQNFLEIQPKVLHYKSYDLVYSVYARERPGSLYPFMYDLRGIYPQIDSDDLKPHVEVIFDDLVLEFGTSDNKKKKEIVSSKEDSSNLDQAKLFFDEDTGQINYRGKSAKCSFGTKSYSLLKFLQINKNTHFSSEEIKRGCNPDIKNQKYCFKNKSDIDDTLRTIKRKFSLKKGAYFPIFTYTKNGIVQWKWEEKS